MDQAPKNLSTVYSEAVASLRSRLGGGKNYDLIEKEIAVGEERMTFFSINGFLKEGELQRLLAFLLTADPPKSAAAFSLSLPYPDCRRTFSEDLAVRSVLSGQTLMLASSFDGEALILDLRSYPGRETAEPESDKVMQGAHDGFVETLVTNTALLRRRVRDEHLRTRCFNLGGGSQPDIVVCYLEGVADPRYTAMIEARLCRAEPGSLTLGFRSLAETLIRRKWYNPFPKVRTTERPDTAAAQVFEGNILLFCDNCPQVMILPTSIFNYLQQTDDYYFPPLTGSYLRLVRLLILLLSLFFTPLWFLYLRHADLMPDAFRFLIPSSPGELPILLQLFLAEIAVDGLKIASMNTPDMLSNSLSIVGGLILGDFTVDVGWFCEDVILYTAFIAIANFAQQDRELGHAFKFLRLMMLGLVALADGYGLIFGALLSVLLVAKNATLVGPESYLYPLHPWNGKAMLHLLFRTKKRDIGR